MNCNPTGAPALELLPVTTDEETAIEVADLVNACLIIDYACDQGVFRGWNMIDKVGSTRRRLQRFAKAMSAIQQQKSADADTPTS